ncbi:hypothetical protein MNBD_NITROSPINAE02-1760 [hydrothermal vent metagenome]|uniref:Glycosyltransferase subfamily 4-like N-terminal domain-containing protein n=1 Tax=hydrothermal vent metagenome TaxID=652676 RepID=A0A3B1CM40_9ZZZZ
MHRNVSLRAVKYITYGILCIYYYFRILKKGDYDVIYANNSVVALAFLFLKPFIKTPIVIRYTDFLSSFLYEDKLYPKFFVDLLKFYEYRIARIFDRVYVITEKMKNELSDIGNVKREKILVTLDGVDDVNFDPKKIGNDTRIEKRIELNIPKTSSLAIFHGTIEPHHGEYILADIINMVTESVDNIYFLLIGAGKGYESIKNNLANNDRVRLLDFVDYVEIPKYIAASDVGMVPYPKNHSMDLVFTLKFLEYLSMGVPCVLFDLESVKTAFGMHEFVKISKTVEEFRDNIVDLARIGKQERAVELIQSTFTWNKVGLVLKGDIVELLSTSGKASAN